MPEPITASILTHFWAPLCAVGSHGEQGPNAQICVSVFGASIVPDRPRLLVVLSNTNYTTGLVAAAGTVSITVLAESQVHLLDPLGLHSGRTGPKLTSIPHELTSAGDPVFSGGAGHLAASVIRSFDLGDSTAFLVAVSERVENGLAPMSWQTARSIVGAEFLERWAEKSTREQAAAREPMFWQE